jgi:hypothetical protein
LSTFKVIIVVIAKKKHFSRRNLLSLAIQLAFDRETLILLVDVLEEIVDTHKKLSATRAKVCYIDVESCDISLNPVVVVVVIDS